MELEQYRVNKTNCIKDATVLKEFIEQERVCDFFIRLNPEFDRVRIQIFM